MRRIITLGLVMLLLVGIVLAQDIGNCGDFHVKPLLGKIDGKCQIDSSTVLIQSTKKDFLGGTSYARSAHSVKGTFDPKTQIIEGKSTKDFGFWCGAFPSENTTFKCDTKTDTLVEVDGSVHTDIENPPIYIKKGKYMPQKDGMISLQGEGSIFGLNLSGNVKTKKDSCEYDLVSGQIKDSYLTVKGSGLKYIQCGCKANSGNFVYNCEKIVSNGKTEIKLDKFNAIIDSDIKVRTENSRSILSEKYLEIGEKGKTTVTQGNQKLTFSDNKISLNSKKAPTADLKISYSGMAVNNVCTEEGCTTIVGSCSDMDETELKLINYYKDNLSIKTSNILAQKNQSCKPSLVINYPMPKNSASQVVSLKVGPSSGNKKNMQKYQDKEVFLISTNEHWTDLLRLVPLVMWDGTENCHKSHGKCAYPLMLYQQDGTVTDYESPELFIKQYGATKLTNFKYKSSTKKLALSKASEVKYYSYKNYLSYWKSYDTVIVSEVDYSAAILASIYAAKLNVFTSDTNLHKYISGKKVITVGFVYLADVYEKNANLKKLQDKLFPNTNKALLINPNDIDQTKGCDQLGLNAGKTKAINLKRSYCSNSVLAPLLAFAKNERIIFAQFEPLPTLPEDSKRRAYYAETKKAVSKVKTALKRDTGKYKYLTILASPRAIPMKTADLKYGKGIPTVDRQLANMKNIPSLGRIYGVSISDVSSYLARSIFFTNSYNTLIQKVKNTVFSFDDNLRWKYYTIPIMNNLKSQGIKTRCIYHPMYDDDLEDKKAMPLLKKLGCEESEGYTRRWKTEHPSTDWLLESDKFSNSDIIYSDGHALSYGGFDILGHAQKLTQFNSAFSVIAACNTNNYYHLGVEHYKSYGKLDRYLYGAFFLRRGGIGSIGAMETAMPDDGLSIREGYGEDIMKALLNDPNIGRALTYTYSSDPYSYKRGCSWKVRPIYYPFELLGDPTINLNFKPIPQKMYVSYYSGIRGGSYRAMDIFSSGRFLRFNLDSPYGTQYFKKAKVKFKTLIGGTTVQEKSVSCSRASYCVGVKNQKRPYSCSTYIRLNPGFYTCEIESGGITEQCPFFFEVKSKFRGESMELYKTYKFEDKSPYGLRDYVTAEVIFSHKNANHITFATVSAKTSNGVELARWPSMKCKAISKTQKKCYGYLYLKEGGKVRITATAYDWKGNTVPTSKTLDIKTLGFRSTSPSNIYTCTNKPITVKGRFSSPFGGGKYWFEIKDIYLNKITPTGKSSKCGYTNQNRVYDCESSFKLSRPGLYHVIFRATDSKGSKISTSVTQVNVGQDFGTELYISQFVTPKIPRLVQDGTKIVLNKDVMITAALRACDGVGDGFKNMKIQVVDTATNTQVPIKLVKQYYGDLSKLTYGTKIAFTKFKKEGKYRIIMKYTDKNGMGKGFSRVFNVER